MSVEVLSSEKQQTKAARVCEVLFHIYLRLLAIGFFLGTLYTWLTVIGYWPGESFRFDTMPVQLKIYSAVMAIILPVASVGLWTTLSWGRVIWFFVIAFQCVSIVRFADILSLPAYIVLLHLITLGIYVVFQILLYFINKKS